MKHLDITFLLAVFMSMVSVQVNAYDCKIDGIYYKLDETTKEATVTSSNSYSDKYAGDVSIPTTISYNGGTYSVTRIGDSAFRDCYGLTSLAIPNSVTSIGSSAFRNCSGLKSITIPKSVKEIASRVLSGCTSLKDVYYYLDYVPRTAGNSFDNSSIASATLHVPSSALSDFKSIAPWSGFGTIVALTEDDEMKAVGIKETSEDSSSSIIFTLDGRKIEQVQKGTNIIKYSDGTSKKVFVK